MLMLGRLPDDVDDVVLDEEMLLEMRGVIDVGVVLLLTVSPVTSPTAFVTAEK